MGIPNTVGELVKSICMMVGISVESTLTVDGAEYNHQSSLEVKKVAWYSQSSIYLKSHDEDELPETIVDPHDDMIMDAQGDAAATATTAEVAAVTEGEKDHIIATQFSVLPPTAHPRAVPGAVQQLPVSTDPYMQMQESLDLVPAEQKALASVLLRSLTNFRMQVETQFVHHETRLNMIAEQQVGTATLAREAATQTQKLENIVLLQQAQISELQRSVANLSSSSGNIDFTPRSKRPRDASTPERFDPWKQAAEERFGPSNSSSEP